MPIPRHISPLPTPRRAHAHIRARLNHFYGRYQRETSADGDGWAGSRRLPRPGGSAGRRLTCQRCEEAATGQWPAMTFAPRRAIVTASDSGIGRATAVALAASGMDIGVTWHSDQDGAQNTAADVAQLDT